MRSSDPWCSRQASASHQSLTVFTIVRCNFLSKPVSKAQTLMACLRWLIQIRSWVPINHFYSSLYKSVRLVTKRSWVLIPFVMGCP